MKISMMILFSFAIWSCNLLTTPDDTLNSNNKMKLLWEIPYEMVGSSIKAVPLIFGDSLVIMSAGKEIVAVEQATGKIRWKSFVSNETNIQNGEFATDGKKIYATHVEDIRAINISDGTLAWLISMPSERGGFWTKHPVVRDNKLFVVGRYTVYCLNAETGQIQWSKFLYDLLGSPIYYLNSVIVSGVRGRYDSTKNIIGTIDSIYSLDVSTGNIVWTNGSKGDGRLNKMVIENEIIYGGTKFPWSSASFEAFNAATGERIWSYYTPNEGWDYNDCVIAGDKIIANTGPYWVSAFNKSNGALLWRTFVKENADSWNVHYYNGYIYHPQGGRLYILDPNDGKIVYSQVGPKNQTTETMAAGNGKVFVCGHPTLQCYEVYKPEK